MPPSYRNLQLYHELTYNRRTQTAVAAVFGLAQCRVSQIAKQVKAWVDQLVEPRHHKKDPGLRFHLAIARERLRLKSAHDPLIDIFAAGDENPRYLRRYVAVVDGVPMNTIEITEEPDLPLMRQAVSALDRLCQLETIANLGPYADIPNQVNQTITRRLTGGRGVLSADSASKSPSNASPTPTQIPSNAPSSTTKNPSIDTENRTRGVLEASPSPSLNSRSISPCADSPSPK